MSLIVSIGGGQNTLTIDKYMINKVNKDKVNILLLPTACNDNPDYCKSFKEHFENLNCNVDMLLLSLNPNSNVIRSKIFAADIIYIGGGNTGRLLRVFKRNNITEYLKEAYKRNIILCGISAGSLYFYNQGYSDTNRSTNPNNPLSIIKGANFIDAFMTPHYNEEERKEFDKIESDIIKIAVEEGVAAIYEDGKFIGCVKENKEHNAYIFIDNKKQVLDEIYE